MTEKSPWDEWPPMRPVRAPGRRRWWSIAALCVAAGVLIAGLAVLAAFILAVGAMANLGSNK